VYSATGGYWKELERSSRMLRLIADYRRADRARLLAASSLRTAEESLTDVATRSGMKDKPVLALAMASDALVLCSADDKLKEDFLDARLVPKVGRRKRSVYPMEQPGANRRRFLGRRRCRQGLCS